MVSSRSLATLLMVSLLAGCGKVAARSPDAALGSNRSECEDDYRFCIWYGAECGLVPENGYFLACSVRREVDCGECSGGLACNVVTRNACGCPKTAAGPCGPCNPGEENSAVEGRCKCVAGSCPDSQTCHRARCVDRPGPAVCADDGKICGWFGTCGAVPAEDWTAACPETPSRSVVCPCSQDGGFDYDAGR